MDKVMEIVIVWGKYVGVELIPLAPCSSTYSSSGIWCVDMSKYGWMVCVVLLSASIAIQEGYGLCTFPTALSISFLVCVGAAVSLFEYSLYWNI